MGSLAPPVTVFGRATAARLLNRHGPIEGFPDNVLGPERERALLFKHLATLKTDAPLFQDVEQLHWAGPTEGFPSWEARIGDKRLSERVLAAARAIGSTPT